MNGLYLLLVAISVATAYVVPIEDCIPNQDCMNVIGCADTLHLPDDSNCHNFFKCSAGRACPMECPTFDGNLQLVFNPLTQTCDWPINVPNRPNCGQGTVKPPTTTSTTTSPSTTPSTTTSSPTTPSTTTSSPTTPSTTTSSPTTPSTTTSSPTTPSTTTTRDPKVFPPECNNPYNRKRLQYEHDCKHYYEIVNGKKVLKECGYGLFNCIIETCDREENVTWCT